MTTYRAPIRDMQFVINELAGLDSMASLPGYKEVTSELVDAVLEEAAKIAGEVLAPHNKLGDERGASLTEEPVNVARCSSQRSAVVTRPIAQPARGRGNKKIRINPMH